MAIGIISTLEVLFVVVNILCIYLLIAKKGKYVDKFGKFTAVSMIILAGLLINITALPSNYIAYKLIEIVLIIINLLTVALYPNEFKVSRIMLSMISAISLIMFFL